MEASSKPFGRFISEKNMQLLEAAAKAPEGGWLRDALGDPELFFALRNDRVDVYYRGCVIYSIEFGVASVTPSTHIKYLVLVDSPYIQMKKGTFDYQRPYLQGTYQPTVSLGQIKSAAKTFSGVESMGVYAAINRDPFVLDVEVAFNRSTDVTEHDGPDSERKQDRIDFVRLRPAQEGYDLVFWEAKHFSNSELFNTKIMNQLAAYENQLNAREDQLLQAFRTVCRFHHDINHLKKALGFQCPSDAHMETLRDLASAKLGLNIVKEPFLFVFGFDKDQKEGRWKQRRADLEAVVGTNRLRAIGNPATAFKPAIKKPTASEASKTEQQETEDLSD